MPSRKSENESGPRLHLLGGIELHGVPREQANALLSQAKPTALLALLLLLSPGRMVRRDRLVGLLWPEMDQSSARGALRKAVHVLRGVLGAERIQSRGDEELGIPPGALWCDARELLAEGERGRLGRTTELYSGDLMPGFYLSGCEEFSNWLDAQRRLTLECASAAAWALAQILESEGNQTDAAQWARRAARFSRDDERVLRRTMTMLARLGDRAGALHVYSDFAERLRRDFSTTPSPETLTLVDSLRNGR